MIFWFLFESQTKEERQRRRKGPNKVWQIRKKATTCIENFVLGSTFGSWQLNLICQQDGRETKAFRIGIRIGVLFPAGGPCFSMIDEVAETTTHFSPPLLAN